MDEELDDILDTKKPTKSLMCRKAAGSYVGRTKNMTMALPNREKQQFRKNINLTLAGEKRIENINGEKVKYLYKHEKRMADAQHEYQKWRQRQKSKEMMELNLHELRDDTIVTSRSASGMSFNRVPSTNLKLCMYEETDNGNCLFGADISGPHGKCTYYPCEATTYKTRRKQFGRYPGEQALKDLESDKDYKSIRRPTGIQANQTDNRIEMNKNYIASLRKKVEQMRPRDWNINYGKPIPLRMLLKPLAVKPVY